ncbi:hypothetical protein C5167_004277 [Papaver somniferum]|nr:hypothetical protein C5167_004277 [Papaver somniferum]
MGKSQSEDLKDSYRQFHLDSGSSCGARFTEVVEALYNTNKRFFNKEDLSLVELPGMASMKSSLRNVEDEQALLTLRQQDDELDDLSASVQRIGGVGLTKHEKLTGRVEFLIVIPFVRLNYCLVCWSLKITGYRSRTIFVQH